MFYLEIKSPFAAFRTFTAGSFRPTAGFMTHSAAYGFLLNLAGIEMRRDDGLVMTMIRQGLPRFRVALGSPVGSNEKPMLPAIQSFYQQLHNYPVGATGKDRAEATKANKYNIVPARRSFLSDLHVFLAADAEPDFERTVLDGLAGRSRRSYGLPFLGDNNFLPDLIRPIEVPKAFWWEKFTEGDLRDNVVRLTISIDRAMMSRTKSALFSPTEAPSTTIPDRAWVEVGY